MKKSGLEKIKKKMIYRFSPGIDMSEIPISSKQGNYYYPYYSSLGLNEETEPLIYNAEGQKMRTFFLRDRISAHSPMSGSKYFVWDRFNWGLNTHFYSHTAMLEKMGKPSKKYAMLIESRTIVPNDYEVFKKYQGLEKEFETVFTDDEIILNKISNAKFVPFSSSFTYGKNRQTGVDKSLYEKKTKMCSILASQKQTCDMHRIRIATAKKCKTISNVDTYGNFDGGEIVEIEKPFTDYRFAIVIENNISGYYFTEKITNCFASQTIPIYLGAAKISEFFNMDGIIQISLKDLENIEGILKQCIVKEYERRIPAILDNYHRVMNFRSSNDYMYEHYFQ